MSSDANRWKEKYLDLIDSHESLERKYEDTSSSMRRAIVQVSLAADGQDEDLDGKLKELRSFLRGNEVITGLNKKMADIETAFESFEQNRNRKLTQALDVLTKIEGELQTQDLPKSLKSELKDFRKAMRSRYQQLSEYPQILTEFSEIVNKAMAVLVAGAGEDLKQEGLWTRIFGKKSSANQDTDDLDKLDGDTAEVSDAGQGDMEFSVSEEEFGEGLDSLSHDLAMVLSNLLSKLSYPDEHINKARALLNEVKDGLEWYQLVPTLEKVADLILVAIGNGQQDFHNFLEALNERLERLQGLMGDIGTHRKEMSADRKAFSAFLQGQVSELKDALNEKKDTQDMRTQVLMQVDALIQGMDSFRHKEEAREAQLEAKLEELTDRLEKMEAEAQAAQEALLVQQLKANTDNLTRLPNRDAWEQRLAHELERMHRYKRPLSLIIADVDFFKNINDSYGHLAGDKVLHLLAKVAQTGIRESDFMARYGGEEFVMLLPETHEAEAATVANKIREVVARCPFHFKGQRVNITMSFGVAEYDADSSTEKTFALADKALYKSKESGRNQVTCASFLTD